MRAHRLLTDLGISSGPSCLATTAMELVRTKLYELESEKDRAREDARRSGPPASPRARRRTFSA